jgi:F-type H+-transporting ATPase subunit epsilon
MTDRVDFELVSPEKLLFSQPVDMLVVPGVEGDFGVLPRHSPLISAIRPGVIKIYEQGRITETIFVSGGFAEVTPSRCTVLAEEAMPVSEIDHAEVTQQLSNLRDDLLDTEKDEDKAPIQRKIAAAEAKLQASS